MATAMAMRRHLTLSYCLAAAVLLLAFLRPPLASAQPLPWQLCNVTAGNYTEGSTYQANIRVLASTLPKNASSSPALFAKGAAGTVPDVVYALALCRGDTNASSCASCVATAFQNAQQLCAFNKRATMFDDPCILRFADWDFLLNTTDNRGMFVAWSFENFSAPVAPVFDAAVSQLFEAAVSLLVNATADYAAANSLKRFGTGEEGWFVTYPKIYSLAQCTPDMTADDCGSCLRDIIGRMTPKYFVGKPGGRVFGVRCNFRFETYSFFAGRPLVQLPAPAIFGTPPVPAPVPVNVTPPATRIERTRNRTNKVLGIVVPTVAAILATIVACFYFWRRLLKPAAKPLQLPTDSTSPDDIQSIESLLLDLSTLRVATDNFAEHNKLGEGGFGVVYKGALPDGLEIAVKRLSQGSRQGIGELKSELVLVAKLHHKNLVKLIGVCLEEHEKILVYEYMPNRSLDTFLFDAERNRELDWGKRFKIINGIARGLQYLHEDSQLKIVHRDLKASNVLLDSDYNPKISDFGLAKIFGGDQSQLVTYHITGTYGYMSPEYAMRGQYSIKSDVFSFGVLVLEITTGRRNCAPCDSEQDVDLLNRTWEHWTREKAIELIDPSILSNHSPIDQMLKCIHIGLSCVQPKPADRPLMSAVNIMLSSNTVTLRSLSRPTFCIQEIGDNSDVYARTLQRSSNSRKASSNEVSITELEPR